MLEVHVSITGLAIFVVIIIVFLIGILLYIFPGSNQLTTIPCPSICDAKEGNISDIERAGSLHQYLCKLHKDYGNIAAFKYGQSLVVSVSNPKHFIPRLQICDIPEFLFASWTDLIGKESFLFAQGTDVFKRREAVDCEISSSAREHYAKVFLSLSKELATKWRGLPEGQHIPLTLHMKGLAIQAVCQMLFGNYFHDSSKVIQLHKAWDACWNKLIAGNKKEQTKKSSLEKARKELEGIFEEAIEYQWSNSKNETTLIKNLLKDSNGNQSEKELLADVLTLFTIGLHVTWAVLTWNFYLVMLHKDVQKDLIEDLQSIKSLDIMPETIVNIQSLKCIIKESVRFSSMFTCSARQHDLNVNFDKHVVAKQTPIIEAVGVAMNDDSLWEDPCKYDIDRFSGEKKTPLNPLDFIPFAFGGSRRSPNSSLVYLLTSIAMACLFREFKLASPGAEINFDDCNYDNLVVMPTKEEVWVVVNSNED